MPDTKELVERLRAGEYGVDLLRKAADALEALSATPAGVGEALSKAFGEPIHIEPRDYLEKVLAGLFKRQPDISGDQRKRLNDHELRAVQNVASCFMQALASLATSKAPAGDAAGVELTREEALRESAYLAGMKAGWNFGIDEDKAGYMRAVDARSGYLKPIRDAQKAALTPPLADLDEAARSEGEVIKRSFVIIHEPGLIPQKKGAWLTDDQLVEFLRECVVVHPDPRVRLTVARLTWNDDLWIDDGREYLQITDMALGERKAKAAWDAVRAKPWLQNLPAAPPPQPVGLDGDAAYIALVDHTRAAFYEGQRTPAAAAGMSAWNTSTCRVAIPPLMKALGIPPQPVGEPSGEDVE